MNYFQNSILDELIADNFAGGGGASTGIELAIGRPVDIAINHDPNAIAMHKVNHPFTQHYQESVWDIDPRKITEGRPVGLAWFSPDCKHFSKAKGGKPVDKKIRGLAWIALRWAGTVRPRIIMLENVEEFMTWGPVKRGRPLKGKQGQTFNKFVQQLRDLGYKVEWRILKACDYGAPTIRKRFYLIARCDGLPIVWSEATHGPGKLPYKTAADCIDMSIPCPSIFGRKKELAVNTQRRIARGLDKFVLKNPKPFIVPIGYGERTGQAPRVNDIDDPLSTVVSSCKQNLVVPSIIQYHSEQSAKEVRGQCVTDPLQTVDGSPRYGVSVCYLSSMHGDGADGRGKRLDDPLPTITADCHENLMAANLLHYYSGDEHGSQMRDPLATVTTKDRHALIEEHLCVLRNNQDCRTMQEPMPTLTTSPGHIAKVRTYLRKIEGAQDLGNWPKVRELLNNYADYNIAEDEILILLINNVEYFIADIGMRMLKAFELKLAQGFPEDYCIDIESKIGKPYSEAKQIARLGNAVCPPVAMALVKANYIDVATRPLQTMAQLVDYMSKRNQIKI